MMCILFFHIFDIPMSFLYIALMDMYPMAHQILYALLYEYISIHAHIYVVYNFEQNLLLNL